MGYRNKRITKKGFFPVDANGNAVDCIYHWQTQEDIDAKGITWEEIKPFNAKLYYVDYLMYAKRVIFHDQDARQWSMFASYLAEIIPLMRNGELEGRFTIQKKGDMYGLVYLGGEE